jgi:hypothetical protein
VLVGSLASTYHGAARFTQNIDLMIQSTPARLREFGQSLPSEEYYVDFVDLDAAIESHSGALCST